MCVKCRPDGELPVGRKVNNLRYIFCIPLLHMTDMFVLYTCYAWLEDYCKGGIFYGTNESTV